MSNLNKQSSGGQGGTKEGSVRNLIEAEKEAQQIVCEAEEQMNKMVKEALEMAALEKNSKQQEWEGKVDAEKTRLDSKKEAVQEQQAKIQDEIAQINEQYDANKEQVIERLLESVMKVSLEVPKVVKQKLAVKEESWE